MDNYSQISASTYGVAQASASKSRVIAAIQNASERSGVDFTYLVNKASQESSLNPTAKASSSSATGLYQFIDQTWLKTVKESGAQYGLSEQADKITIGSDGVARVASAADRKAILAMRNDPVVSAEMAAELTKTNKTALESKVGGEIGSTELYLAHFLGAGGASQLLKTMKNNPTASAASILPQAAQANKSVFYDETTGKAKSVSDIYQHFAAKFDDTPASSGTTSRVASLGNSTLAAQDSDLTSLVQDDTTASLLSSSLMGTTSGSSMTLSNGITLDKGTPTPFATMMLAQMDMDTFGMNAMDSAYQVEKSNDNDARVKSAYKIMADAA